MPLLPLHRQDSTHRTGHSLWPIVVLLLALSVEAASAQTSLGAFTGRTLVRPAGIVQLASGNVLVNENGQEGQDTGATQEFTADGTFVRTLASGLAGPYGITQLADGTVLVADAFGGTVLAYDLSGTEPVAASFGSGISGPTDVVQLASGNVLVVDVTLSGDRSGSVREFTADGAAVRTFASGLDNPFGITQLADGTVLVTEASQNTVLAFDPATGALADAPFATGLDGPTDVVQLSNGTVLVANAGPTAGSGNVVAFDADGSNRRTFASAVSGPFGIEQLANGTVLVSEYDDGEVVAFSVNPVSTGEAAAHGGVVGLPSPNPAPGPSALTVEVATAQSVRVAVYDALGREVLVAHDGVMRSGSPVLVALDGARLAPGVYTVLVAGETLRASRLLTVAR